MTIYNADGLSEKHPRQLIRHLIEQLFNTAFMKTLDGECTLSPLFDFAPMFMDSAGIPRAATWDNEAEKIKGSPDWGKVAIDLSTELNCDAAELSAWLTSLTV